MRRRRLARAAVVAVVASLVPSFAACTAPAPAPPAASSAGASPARTTASPSATPLSDLAEPALKEIAMELVSSAENSSLDWRAQYRYLEDIGDGRGYTGGIIGFCSGTGDLREVVRRYTDTEPGNGLARFLPALERVDGTDSHAGLGAPFARAWRRAAKDPVMQAAQDAERDAVYFDPAVRRAKADGLRALGQFIYYDAMVMHGPGDDPASFGGIRWAALRRADPPSRGGDEKTYLEAFLSARKKAMRAEAAHEDTSRVDTAQLAFLEAGNLDLTTPLEWQVYGDSYRIG